MNDEQRGTPVATKADLEQLESRLGLRIEAAINKPLIRWFVTVTMFSLLGIAIAAAFVIARYVR